MNIADNQQRAKDLGWIAALIDGEGTVGFAKRANNTFYPRVRITNTSKNGINHIVETLNSFDIESNTCWFAPNKKQRKPYAVVTISGVTRIEKLDSLITNSLTIKYGCMKLVEQWLVNRDSEFVKQLFQMNTLRAFNEQIPNTNTDENLGWLAGMLDGEGSVMIQCDNGRTRRMPIFKPEISIANTSNVALKRVELILDSLNIGYYHEDAHVSKTRIFGLDRTESLLTHLYPLLFIRNEQARLLAEWIIVRKERPRRSDPSEHELSLINQIRVLNAGKSIPKVDRIQILCPCGLLFSPRKENQKYHTVNCEKRFRKAMF